MRCGIFPSAWLIGLCVGCAPDPSSPPSSIPSDDAPRLPMIVLTLDTTRADHLGFYGYPRSVTPNLDRIAEESVIFDRCITPMATTLPAHTSLFTGTYPLEHGVLANIKHGGRPFPVGAGLDSVAEVADRAGYRTGAVVSAAPLKKNTNISAGFAFFDEPEGRERNASATMDIALEWLEKNHSTPFFLWVHFFDPHYPLTPPPQTAGTFSGNDDLSEYFERRGFPPQCLHRNGEVIDTLESINLYDEEILFVDGAIGRLRERLEAWDLWERTILIVVGDHGEGLCQHGQRDHGYVHHEQLRIPLLIKFPGKEPRRIQEVTSIVDVFPIVFEWMGDERWRGFLEQSNGRSRPNDRNGSRYVFSQRTERKRDDLPPVSYALTGERWKFIFEPKKQGRTRLFDLEADPHELRDVLDANEEEAERLTQKISALLEHFSARRAEFFESNTAADDMEPVDEERLEQLRSLGYVDAAAPGT